MIICTIITICLSKAGIIESKTFNNTISNSTYTVEKKESFGFWQPNVATLFVVSSAISGLYLDNKKIVITSIIIYLYILQETVSRTYLPIPIIIATFYLFKYIKINRKTLFLLPLTLLCHTFLVIPWIISIPDLLSSILSPNTLLSLDNILSHRIFIALNTIKSINIYDLLTGTNPEKTQIDSLYINYIISQGLVSFSIASIAVSTLLLKLLKTRNSKNLVICFSYLLISNFESAASASSLIFYVFILSITPYATQTTKLTKRC